MAQGRLCKLLGGVALAAFLAGTAYAQAQSAASGVDRRLERIERDLKTVQSIVLQAQATGQPVVVRPEGADPALVALQGRVDDLEATLQRINGQIETLGREIDDARRADQAAEVERRAQAQVLNERLSRIEAQLSALAQATTAADPALATTDPAAPPASAASAATARAQAGDTGVLGGRPAVPHPPPPPTPADEFASARDLFTSGKPAAAADALQDFVTRYPTNARTPEAYYWLGESYYAQRGFQNATAAYASALRNRPSTAWAPAAMVRLAQSLVQSDQSAQACAALVEFDRRYAARASQAVKTNAEAVRKRAACR